MVETERWIPVSERLPEDCDIRFYMCIAENHEEDLPMFCQYEEERGFGFWRDIYDEKTLGFVDSEFQTNEELGYEKVVAWMPLPEPYSADTEKPQTNADRIRSMTDEELAEWFNTVTKDVLGGSTWDKNGWLKWLKAESEGEDAR